MVRRKTECLGEQELRLFHKSRAVELCESAASQGDGGGREGRPVGVASVLEGRVVQNHSWRLTLKQEASSAGRRRVLGIGLGGVMSPNSADNSKPVLP